MYLIWSQRSLMLSSTLFILFTLFYSSEVVSTILSSSSLIHSSVSDILLLIPSTVFLGLPGGSEVKVSAWNAGDPGSIPGSGKIPWRRKWQPTPVLLPGESHGGRSLVGYSPWGRKELDTTERLHFHFHSIV